PGVPVAPPPVGYLVLVPREVLVAAPDLVRVDVQVLRPGLAPVVGDARERSRAVRAVGGGVPLVGDPEMVAHAEAQALVPGRLAPGADAVDPGAHARRVPSVVPRV